MGDLDKLAIILSRSEFSSFPEVALLVSITSARDGVIWAHYCCRVWISLESDSDEKKKMVSRFKAQKNSIRGKFLPKTQRWCVDKPMENLTNVQQPVSKQQVQLQASRKREPPPIPRKDPRISGNNVRSQPFQAAPSENENTCNDDNSSSSNGTSPAPDKL